MEATTKKNITVAHYFAAQPPVVRALLDQVRAAVLKAAPGAEEVISYSMPAVRQDGIVVWYAAAKGHIGFYPRPSAIEAFRDELTKYKTSKGAIQFPMDQPMPLSLITKMVKYRLKENKEQASLKKVKAIKKG